MQLIGLARLGKDTELRYLPSGKAIAQLSLAYNYGRKGDDGKQPTQWVDAALMGDRAEKIAQYLTKGKMLYVQIDDVHIETWEKKDGGTGVTLKGFVGKLEFTGGNDDRKTESKSAKATPAPKAAEGEFQDDDIPFN